MSLITHVTECLVRDQIIENDEREIVEYGLESIWNTLLGLGIVFVIGGFLQCVWESLGLWVFLLPLRKSAGGYHANTKGKCLIISAIMIIIALICIMQEWRINIYTIILAIFSIVIGYIAPVDTANKKLDNEEVRVYRKRTRYILLIEIILYFIAVKTESFVLSKIIAMVIALVGVAVVIGKADYSLKREKEL